MPSLKDLNQVTNIQPRVRKDGDRKVTNGLNDKTGELLAAAGTPEQVGKLAKEHGITIEEIFARAEKAPNFGQFRMVIGNRIRGIIRRKDANPDMSWGEAANPKKRESPSNSNKGSKKASKKVAKKAAAPAEAVVATKKTGKKISKKASKKAADTEDSPSPE